MPDGRYEGMLPPRRDVLDLAGREATPPAPEAGRWAAMAPEDPVVLARRIIADLLMLMDMMPVLAPIIRRFLDDLSRAGRVPVEAAEEGRGRERGAETPPPRT